MLKSLILGIKKMKNRFQHWFRFEFVNLIQLFRIQD